MKNKLNSILLIDDDESTNFISNMLLEEANCTLRIQIEESGKNALKYLSGIIHCGKEKPSTYYPELIFLDINMPAMNGWEFLDEYRELILELNPKTVIIMLTTSINPDDRSKAENIPLVAAFANKPLTRSMISRIIKEHFSEGWQKETHSKKREISLYQS